MVSGKGWNIVESYFKSSKYRLTEHQLDSFNTFVYTNIPKIVGENNPFIMKKKEGGKNIEVRVYIGGKSHDKLYYSKPTISIDGGDFEPLVPSICRNMGSVYDFEISADVIVETEDYKTQETITTEFPRVSLARVPTMLHSKLCYLRDLSDEDLSEFGEDPKDKGGYFIVDGKEKVVISQEIVAPNNVILRPKKDGMQVFFRSSQIDSSVKPVEFEIYTKLPKDNRIYANIRAISKEIPLSVLFRLLGYESDKDIVEAVVGKRYLDDDSPRYQMICEVLRESLVNHADVWTREEAIEYVRTSTPYKTVDHVLFIIQRHMLPGSGHAVTMKGLELGRLTKRLIEGILGFAEMVDRESFLIKQVQPTGQLLAEVFSDSYMKFKKQFRDELDKTFYFGPWNQSGKIELIINSSNIAKLMRAVPITENMYKSFKGSWGLQAKAEAGGIVQDLNRLSYIGFLSHLRRVNNPLDREIKTLAPHRLHGTQWGSLCPVESPDGASIGLLKNLAILCRVTSDADPKRVMSFIETCGAIKAASMPTSDAATKPKILINGVWIYCTDDPIDILVKTRSERSKGQLGEFVSISFNIHTEELHFYTTSGRCTRPLIVNSKIKNVSATSWEDLLSTGAVEYIDVRESDNIMISMDLDTASSEYTHSELHPSTIFSVYSVTVPLLSHNPGNRNTLSAAQSKQAASHFSSAYRFRADAIAFALDAPERPLVTTKYETLIGVDSHPQGQNAIVAIMSFTGYNQEDAIILNKTSVERGMFKTSYFKSVIHREELGKMSDVYFSSTYKIDGVSRTSIDENGFPFENDYVKEGQPLIGIVGEKYENLDITNTEDDGLLVSYRRNGMQKTVRNMSPVADSTWKGLIVDNVVVNTISGTIDAKPMRTCRIRYRKTRFPDIGDKFASRHAQKGVLGMVIAQHDMPYSESGIVPDVIINPHGFPSRMTIGHLLESILAKGAAISGEKVDATMFEDPNVENSKNVLSKYGYEKSGEEVLYNPSTGMPLEASIFIAPIYYQRLKHMSQDKVKARQSGRISSITRQPTGTTGSEKPLKIGEMEASGILAHGTSSFFYESSMEKSDSTDIWTDRKGDVIAYNEKQDRFLGISDTNETVFTKHKIPFAMNVLKHETETLGIGVTFEK